MRLKIDTPGKALFVGVLVAVLLFVGYFGVVPNVDDPLRWWRLYRLNQLESQGPEGLPQVHAILRQSHSEMVKFRAIEVMRRWKEDESIEPLIAELGYAGRWWVSWWDDEERYHAERPQTAAAELLVTYGPRAITRLKAAEEQGDEAQKRYAGQLLKKLGMAEQWSTVDVMATGHYVLYDDEGRIRVVTEASDSVVAGYDPSQPVFSPNRKRFAFVDPFDLETHGKIYVYDPVTARKSEFGIPPRLEPEYAPKEIAWLDNSRLGVVIGYAYGTVTRGGNLWLMDAQTGAMTKVVAPRSDEYQLWDLKLAGPNITLGVFDPVNYKELQTVTIPLAETLDAAKSGKLLVE